MHVRNMRVCVCMYGYVYSYMELAYIYMCIQRYMQLRVHRHEACMYVYMCTGHAMVISSI